MKILVTGSKGFVGRNIVAQLNTENHIIYEYDLDTDPALLNTYTSDCEFVFHLAGVNRSENKEEFMKGNFGFTSVLLDSLKANSNFSPILITSSIQALRDNVYGTSKKAGEDLLFAYGKETGAKVYVYRLANLFGKWSRPNYNTVVATFCHNIARELEIRIDNANAKLTLCYIDDLIDEFMNTLDDKPTRDGEFCKVAISHNILLGELAEIIQGFKDGRKELNLPKLMNPFIKKLYSTYLSFLPTDEFSYPLKMNVDNRGSFTEFIKTPDRGQVSVNISKKGVTKGNHWHHSKNEKFLVVSGEGVIRFRKVGETEVIKYNVSSEKLEVIDIPVGYTHSISNTGETDMITVMWANEIFDKDNPDTYYEEV